MTHDSLLAILCLTKSEIWSRWIPALVALEFQHGDPCWNPSCRPVLEMLEIQHWIGPRAGIVDGGFSQTYAGIIASISVLDFQGFARRN